MTETNTRGPRGGTTRASTVVTAAATTAAAVVTGVATAPGARAETVTVPTSSATVVTGHGYGHGHGMSQWGAYGAAKKGLTWSRIVHFYYPGTTVGSYGNPILRIRLSGLPSSGVTVKMATGLKLQTSSGYTNLGSKAGGKAIDGWRIVRDGPGQSLQYHAGGRWSTNASYRRTTRNLGFAHVGGAVRVQLSSGGYRDYPDRVRSIVTSGGLMPLNVTRLDSYLRGVVPNEMPSSWPTQALRSQAVVARTYAANGRHSGSYDLCDSTACQVYKGLADYTSSGTLVRSNTAASTDAAVSATSGKVVDYHGSPAFTQFSASNGGWVVAGNQPYLVAKADPYDGVPTDSWSPHAWTLSGGALRSSLQRAYSSVGTVKSLSLTRDGHGDWGGRVERATVIGSSGRVTVTGDQLRWAIGLRSTWFTVPSEAPAAPKPVAKVSGRDTLSRDTSGDGRPDVYGRASGGVLWRMSFTGSRLGAKTALGHALESATAISYGGDLDGTAGTEMLARAPHGRLYCYRVHASGPVGSRRWVRGIPARFTRVTGIGDATGDGNGDIVAIDKNSGYLYLWAGNGACGTSKRIRLGTTGWNEMNKLVGAGDVTGDGKVDLLARQRHTGKLFTYRLDGHGRITGRRVTVGTGWAVMRDFVGLGDVDGDQNGDLLTRDRKGRVWFYRGTGSGTFEHRTSVGGHVGGMRLLR